MRILRTSGSGKGLGLKDPARKAGRPKGSVNKRTQDLRDMVEKVCGNPVEAMARIAQGDVIALGYMTEKELREPPTFDARGRVVRPSGIERALSYVPPELRAKMLMEISQYLYPKKRAIVVEDEDGNNAIAAGGGLMLYLPHNGREEPTPGVTVKKKPKSSGDE